MYGLIAVSCLPAITCEAREPAGNSAQFRAKSSDFDKGGRGATRAGNYFTASQLRSGPPRALAELGGEIQAPAASVG